MLIAMTREVSASIARCELTHLVRAPIDVERARDQHRAYQACLAALGCAIHALPPEHELPDAVFVEDAAVVLDEVAIITRPGAETRRRETPSIAAALAPLRSLRFIEGPGTVDGGDVLCIGRTLFVGLSARSNPEAIAQMRTILAPLGYQVEGVPLSGCLHLKSAATTVAAGTILVNREWVDPRVFGEVKVIDIDPTEPFAANALLIEDVAVYPAAFPATHRRLEESGISVRTVDVSELAKAEGAVTCCSLVLPVGNTPAFERRG